ncbi:hypothetical protein [Serratia rubidaea]|uniref:Pectate lyase superfamily protein n=1 Tax=Serratia rubidaea TaxID=61652 RepID=A0A448SPN2_SERRU|nr:hypothetical protein [Serratia rubidaea]MBH1929056.1 hypothetical protein [Serratia rubidaea]MDC6118887.1 hypothetical protein [Serratia rubidaea]MEB7588176.1 hypothetical protein [Serratia rubidaea]VEI69637.1 Uncharacterised protein [Serratia rubidaea]
MGNIDAKSVTLTQGGTVQDAVKYITPEMFGAVGDGSADDSGSIIAAMNYAIKIGVNAVRGDGIYRIDKGIPCKSGVINNSSGALYRFGFNLSLNVVIVGDNFPALPEKWWDAQGAFYSDGKGSTENFNLSVSEFFGNFRATFFKVQGNGLSTSSISCDEMRGHIIGFKNYVDPVRQSGMNKIRGKNWQTGYIACLIGGTGNGGGNSECHNIDLTWCATHRFGGISLQDRSQYANINNGTYDYNGKYTSVLTLTDVVAENAYSIEFGYDITSGNKKSVALSSVMRGYENQWQLVVAEDSDITDGESKFSVGDVITAPGFSATVSGITVPSKKTTIYMDIIISNRTGDFSKVHVAADYVGGIFGHNLFTNDIWAPSSAQNIRNMSYRGLGIGGTASKLEMYSTQHNVRSPFAAVTDSDFQVNKNLTINGTSKLQGTTGNVLVPHNTAVWALSLNSGSNTPVSMWKIYVTSSDSNIYGEFTVANTSTFAKVIGENSGYVSLKTENHRIMLSQSSGSTRTLYYNAVRLM